MPPSRNSKHNHHVIGVPDFFLESFLGQMMYHALSSKKTSGHGFYPEEQEGFQIPERYYKTHPEKAQQPQTSQQDSEDRRDSDLTLVEQSSERRQRKEAADNKLQGLKDGGHKDPESQLTVEERELLEMEEARSAEKSKQTQTEDLNLVSWYGPDDPANPMK